MTCSGSSAAANSDTRRVFPMPGSPVTSASRLESATERAHTSRRDASSDSRPSSGPLRAAPTTRAGSGGPPSGGAAEDARRFGGGAPTAERPRTRERGRQTDTAARDAGRPGTAARAGGGAARAGVGGAGGGDGVYIHSAGHGRGTMGPD